MTVYDPTGAMRDIFDDRRPRLEQYIAAVTFVPGRRGTVFAVDGRVRGLDLFDRPAALRRMLPMLISRYGLDALISPEPRPSPRAASQPPPCCACSCQPKSMRNRRSVSVPTCAWNQTACSPPL